jgi:hypothetical protein
MATVTKRSVCSARGKRRATSTASAVASTPSTGMKKAKLNSMVNTGTRGSRNFSGSMVQAIQPARALATALMAT